MPSRFQQLMNQATRLTRSGDLAAATAAIQSALRGGRPAQSSRQDESDIIDVEAWEIPERHVLAPTRTLHEDVCAEMPRPVVHGDAFTAGSFRNSAGLRHYKLYVPPDAGN